MEKGAPDVFRTEVRIAAAQVAGLGAAELSAALAYEVEPFSGVSAAEAELEYTEIPDADPTVRVFSVAVRRRRGARSLGALGDCSRWLKPAAVFAALVAVALAADAWWLHSRRAALTVEVAERLRLDSDVKAVLGRARECRVQTEKLRREREDAAAAQDEIARLRAAYPELFHAIADVLGNQAVVKSFARGETPFSLRLTAVAISPDAAARVMATLGRRAAECHWRLEPGEIEALGAGETVRFDCTLMLDTSHGR